MWKSTKDVGNNDVETLIDDPQARLCSTKQSVPAKSEELRCHAAQLLGQASFTAQTSRQNALLKGREIAAKAEDYVNERPWHAVLAATGAGILLGTLLGRSKYISELGLGLRPKGSFHITIFGFNRMY